MRGELNSLCEGLATKAKMAEMLQHFGFRLALTRFVPTIPIIEIWPKNTTTIWNQNFPDAWTYMHLISFKHVFFLEIPMTNFELFI